MIDILIEPFTYDYMAKAILISTIVGALCGFLSSSTIAQTELSEYEHFAKSLMYSVATTHDVKFLSV